MPAQLISSASKVVPNRTTKTLWVLLLSLKTLWVLLLSKNIYFPAHNFYSHEGDAGGLLHRKFPANPPQTNDVGFASKFENFVGFASKQKYSRHKSSIP